MEFAGGGFILARDRAWYCDNGGMRYTPTSHILLAALAIVAAQFLGACGAGHVEDRSDQAHELTVELETKSNRLRGYLVIGHEVRSFRPCGSDEEYWVRAEEGTLDELRASVAEWTSEPYQPVFVELEGCLSAEVGDGFASDYDGTAHIERLVGAAPAAEGCTEENPSAIPVRIE